MQVRYLLAAIVHHEEQVGAVGHGEGEAVLERVGAVVVVADAVLVDVVHGEAAGLAEVLAVACALDGAVARSLDNGEDDGLRLQQKGMTIYGYILEENKASRGSPDLSVGICGLQLKLCDGLPHSFLDPHAWNLEQGQGVVHGLDSNVEALRNLERTLLIELLRKEGLKEENMWNACMAGWSGKCFAEAGAHYQLSALCILQVE